MWKFVTTWCRNYQPSTKTNYLLLHNNPSWEGYCEFRHLKHLIPPPSEIWPLGHFWHLRPSSVRILPLGHLPWSGSTVQHIFSIFLIGILPIGWPFILQSCFILFHSILWFNFDVSHCSCTQQNPPITCERLISVIPKYEWNSMPPTLHLLRLPLNSPLISPPIVPPLQFPSNLHVTLFNLRQPKSLN